MASRALLSLSATLLALCTTVPAMAQPPPSALVNQQSAETVEAARAASPHTSQETLAYFEEDVEARLTWAIERVWDPRRPRQRSARTPWGDPNLAGYWLSVTYTPLERPDELAGKAFYTPQEAIGAYQRAVVRDASVDPATVHYDWTESSNYRINFAHATNPVNQFLIGTRGNSESLTSVNHFT